MTLNRANTHPQQLIVSCMDYPSPLTPSKAILLPFLSSLGRERTEIQIFRCGHVINTRHIVQKKRTNALFKWRLCMSITLSICRPANTGPSITPLPSWTEAWEHNNTRSAQWEQTPLLFHLFRFSLTREGEVSQIGGVQNKYY